MNNISLKITEQQSLPTHKSSTYAYLFNEPNTIPGPSENNIGSSPPSFTSTLFSCCSGDWEIRHKRREMQSPLFTPNMSPQNMIIEPMDISIN